MARRYKGIPLFLTAMFCLVVACDPSHESSVDGMDSDTLTVVDLNIWHGLNPKGALRFVEYETRAEREERFRGFLEQARRLDADIVFLQEVNPAPGLTRRIADALGMEGVYQIDNAGMKIGSVGLPVNFRSGLAILARRGLGLKKLGARKLSGPFGICSRALSFQFAEFRYALAAQVIVNGQKTLLINVHLHHGHEMTPDYAQVIEEAVSEGVISRERASQLTAIARSTSDRRRLELSGAISLAREHGLDVLPVIFAGDFNASPDAPEMRWLNATCGFRSVTDDESPQGLLLTWDATRNEHTRRIEDFEPANEFDAFLLERDRGRVLGESRRLDYVLTRNVGGSMEVEEAGLFGDEPFRGGMISDHFGIYAKFRLMREKRNPQ